jgi:hypothetical protein
MNTTLKIGTRVRCIAYDADTETERQYFIGKIGQIIREISTAGYVRVDIASSAGGTTLFKPEELEIID